MAKNAHDLCHGRSYIFENLFWNLYSKFAYIFNSDFVSKDERAYYEAICGRKDPDHGANTLNFLSGVLFRYYNKKVIILLDEYDTPLIEAFSEGGWNEMLKYIKFLFYFLI